jgi:hypothetical protein
LCGCKTRSLTLREEHRLKVFEKRVLRRTCGPKRDDRGGECYIIRSLMICTTRKIFKGPTQDEFMGGACGTHGGERYVQGFGGEN